MFVITPLHHILPDLEMYSFLLHCLTNVLLSLSVSVRVL